MVLGWFCAGIAVCSGADPSVGFAEVSDARVRCMLVAPDELGTVEAFLAVESDEQAGTLPDLFVQLFWP